MTLRRRVRTAVIEWCLAVAVTWFWPFAAFLPSYDARLEVLTGVVAGLFAVTLAIGHDRSVARHWSLMLLTPLALFLLSLAASIGHPAIDRKAVEYFCLVVMPLCFAAHIGRASLNVRKIGALAFAFLIL